MLSPKAEFFSYCPSQGEFFTKSSPSFTLSVMHDTKENCKREKAAFKNSWEREAHVLSPEFHADIISSWFNLFTVLLKVKEGLLRV